MSGSHSRLAIELGDIAVKLPISLNVHSEVEFSPPITIQPNSPAKINVKFYCTLGNDTVSPIDIGSYVFKLQFITDRPDRKILSSSIEIK